MGNNVHLGDGALNEAKANINSRINDLVKIIIDVVFDYFEGAVKDLPEKIEHLRSSPEVEQKIASLCSEHLFEEGLVPRCYKGLPDNLLISNIRQDEYVFGLYGGYILAMIALVDNDVPKDIILAVRDYIRPIIFDHPYDDRIKFVEQFNKDEKYSWIDKANG